MCSPRLRALVVTALGVQLVAARAALAQPSSANEAAAQALFDQGTALLRDRDYAAACPKLDESQRLDPAGGTLVALALCREGEGKTATAWVKFNEALGAARRDGRADRERVAREHIAALAPRLTRLAVVVSEGARSTPGLELRIDGELTPLDIAGTAIPVDPGAHAVRATAPGRVAWETRVTTDREGATVPVTVPPLEAMQAGAAPPPPVAPPPEPVAAVTVPPSTETTTSPGRGQRTLALIAGGVGVIGLGIGTVYGVEALSKKGQENAANGCPNGSTGACSQTGVSLSKTAVQDGNISSIALGAGALIVAGAAVLWLTAPSGSAIQVAPSVGQRGAGLAVLGAW